MKCPACGHWNRASFPVCFRCGETLLHVQAPDSSPLAHLESDPAEFEDQAKEIIYDQYGQERERENAQDRLAREMLSLHERKRRGEVKQKQLQARGAKQGFAPSGAGVSGYSRRNRAYPMPSPARNALDEGPGSGLLVDYDGFVDQPSYHNIVDSHASNNYLPGQNNNSPYGLSYKRPKARRLIRRMRFLPWLLLAISLAFGGYWGFKTFIEPAINQRAALQEDAPKAYTAASILDDMAAHTISIPAPEGSQIYIKELRKTFMVTGGYATFQVPDYFWYEQMESVNQESMDVSLTPFIRTSSGVQKEMEPVPYTINIPLSPITLISPDVTRLVVSTPIYNVRFQVMQNSQVYINGEDYSSFVNTQNGLINYNATVQPVGDNRVRIEVRSQYYRDNSIEIILHREVQDIPLDLASTLDDESSNEKMTIRATTRAGATITIISPHEALDTSMLGSTGEFSFDAKFSKIGINTVEIRADFPGKNPTIVKYDVYYLPDPNVYTKKAWALNDWGYPNLLANLETRIANTQIYVFTGPVLEFKSQKPQLAIIDAGDGGPTQRLVLVENQTKTQWELGKRYRIYGDAYGVYGSIPRIIARYTYRPQGE